MTAPIYLPPSTALIAAAQNETEGLRLLLAQRRLHSRAKSWAMLRMLGLGIIAILAPIVAAISPPLSVYVGAVAAAWFVLSRTLFLTLERRYSERGAVVQEMFDRRIYGMPELGVRRNQVTPEEVARVVGPVAKADRRIDKERLRDWYPLDPRLDGADAIAIAQRANAAYSERLLFWNASIWLGVIVLWSVVAISLSWALGFTLEVFLLSVALPVMPPLLDTYDEWLQVRNAGKERRALAQAIHEALAEPSQPHVPASALLVWQDQLFTLRRDSPQVPNLVYKAMRDSNERAMSAAADELTELVLGKVAGAPK
ncbi:S-4TM family putative pore-forming effector [Agromyces aurantiacus]|uniref:S-4TM family putative pore-forming effector n=1 Tax=Agromyces aurantiacus TaxID=165814 RepID=A0ABV9R477_9MICO|nr:S-4TM family putative pore-forming effector [Agromyces aurantiacus]MBM7502940.1 hypothetical protein [Agromyces aurantiacus]